MTVQEHAKMWSPYKAAQPETREAWAYTAACAIVCRAGEEAAHLALCLAVADEILAAKARGEKSCVWHAHHKLIVEKYNRGELPTAICEHCGGRADVRVGFHHLCRALAARNLLTPRLDVVDAMQCPCAQCARKAA